MISNIYDKLQDKKYYNEWMENLKDGYESSSVLINEVYKTKEYLSPELANVYVARLMDYYSKLKHLYILYISEQPNQSDKQKLENYNVIRNEITLLLAKYTEFVLMISSIKDIEVYKDIGVPNEFLILNDYI